MRINNVLQMHRANVRGWLGTPLLILGAAWLVVLLFVIATRIATNGSTQVADEMYNGMQWNGAVWSVLGPLIGTGFAMMSQYFPLALGLGITRREFWAGTALHVLTLAGIFTAIITALRLVEDATGGWFIQARMFNNAYTGTGEWWHTPVQTFAILTMALFIGLLFATVFSRWGQTGIWFALGGLVIAFGILVFFAIAVESFGEALLNGVTAMPWGGWMTIMGGIALIAAAVWFRVVRGAQAR